MGRVLTVEWLVTGQGVIDLPEADVDYTSDEQRRLVEFVMTRTDKQVSMFYAFCLANRIPVGPSDIWGRVPPGQPEELPSDDGFEIDTLVGEALSNIAYKRKIAFAPFDLNFAADEVGLTVQEIESRRIHKILFKRRMLEKQAERRSPFGIQNIIEKHMDEKVA